MHLPTARRHLVVASVLGSLLLVRGAASAAELAGARLELSRSEAAQACPDEAAFASALQARMSPRQAAPAGPPLLLRVALDSDGARFRATVEVSGRKHGLRHLDAAGPTCDELSDALVVSLLLLLDEDPTQEAPTPSATAAPLQPAHEQAALPSVWVAAGGAVTHGLPESFSAALAADVWFRLHAWQAGLGVVWAPERRVLLSPGAVDVQAMGGRLSACWAPLFTDTLRLNACGWGAILSLSGSPHDFRDQAPARRPWFLAGAGPALDWLVSDGVALGLAGSSLVTLHDESFSVQGLGTAYETDRVVGWLGAYGSIQIW